MSFSGRDAPLQLLLQIGYPSVKDAFHGGRRPRAPKPPGTRGSSPVSPPAQSPGRPFRLGGPGSLLWAFSPLNGTVTQIVESDISVPVLDPSQRDSRPCYGPPLFIPPPCGYNLPQAFRPDETDTAGCLMKPAARGRIYPRYAMDSDRGWEP